MISRTLTALVATMALGGVLVATDALADQHGTKANGARAGGAVANQARSVGPARNAGQARNAGSARSAGPARAGAASGRVISRTCRCCWTWPEGCSKTWGRECARRTACDAGRAS